MLPVIHQLLDQQEIAYSDRATWVIALQIAVMSV